MSAVEQASTHGEEREFEFSRRDFERVRSLIHARAGISLNPSKQNMVYSRLSRRLRALGAQSFAEYLDRLERSADGEWQNFVNSLTTNLTAFFREPHHFPVLGELLKSRPADSHNPIVLWCSAASTGEEPYSMAMQAVETFGTMTPPVRILATDIDTAVLETARRGVYTTEALERVDPQRVKRHFMRGTGANAGMARVRPELQAMVSFRRLNLLERDWQIGRGFDAIFCRNVMIYFEKDTQRGILERFAPLLQPWGLLFAGHSENFSQARDLFTLRGKTVYRLATASERS
jgi:chemotaxis protein methyltransferase CheR